MRILSTKKSICTSMKVLYSDEENIYEDVKRKSEDGWRVVQRPNFYCNSYEWVMKKASNGWVITYVRYEKMG